jgi:hexosaminidase
MLFPRLCALSEVFWSPRRKRDFEDFCARLGAHERRLRALDLLYYKGKLSK